MKLTVRDLIEMLEDMPEHAEVRLATQPRWPFEYSIDVVTMVDLGADQDDEARDMREEPSEPIVYIAEGTQLGYLPGAAARELVWK